MPEPIPPVNVARERLTKVFRFLQALNELRNPVVRQVQELRWSLWFRDLPDHPTVRYYKDRPGNDDDEQGSGFLGASDYVLRVARPRLTVPPTPPKELLAWLRPGWEDPSTMVSVYEAITEGTDGIVQEIRFESVSRLGELLSQWKEKRDRWATQEVPARRASALFEDLYRLNSVIGRESERYELILGEGLLIWHRQDTPLYHPILLQRLELTFDPSVPEFRFAETVQPPEFFAALFRGLIDVPAKNIAAIHDDLAEHDVCPLGGDETAEFIARTAVHLSPLGRFCDRWPPESSAAEPRLYRQPMIFLRDRTHGFGTAIESILQDLSTREEFPPGLGTIVGIEHGTGPAEPVPGECDRLVDPNGLDEQVLLSKEANASQVEIVRRLERHDAVLVQGPPGTGKTHTIANILGHLLAQGKSVLVTAHTAKALRVLRDYVTEPLRPLCVSVLDDGNGLLESSIDAISSRLSDSDADTLDREAARLRLRRLDTLSKLRTNADSIFTARASEYRSITMAGRDWDPSEAARYVAAHASEAAWIPGPLDPKAPLPLTGEEVATLYRTNEAISQADEEDIRLGFVSTELLMTPHAFSEACRELARLSTSDLELGKGQWNPEICGMAAEGLAKVLSGAQQAVMVLDSDPWELSIIDAGREGGGLRQAWLDLVDGIEDTVAKANAFQPVSFRFDRNALAQHIPEPLLPALRAVVEYMQRGGKVGPLQLVRHREWRAVFDTALQGKTPRDPDFLAAILATTELSKSRDSLRQRWEQQVSRLGGPSWDELGDAPERSCREFLPRIFDRLNWFEKTWSPIAVALKACGLCWDSLLGEASPVLGPYGSLLLIRHVVRNRLAEVIEAQIGRMLLEYRQGQLDRLVQVIESAGISEGARLGKALINAVASRDTASYDRAYQRLSELRGKASRFQERLSLLRKVSSVAPKWASAIESRLGAHAGPSLPGDPEAAWQWRQLAEELDRRAATSLEGLLRKDGDLRSELQRVTAELVEKMTWAAQTRRTTLSQRQALHGYRTLMAKVGKRKGKRVPRLLAEARRLMPICQSAVPVWIMPISRVVESFVPGRNHFDVVIIDEASQADVMALTTLYMGRQLIVVGDREQVTPEAIGQRVDDVQQLIDSHLQGVPQAQLYDGQTSLYDLAGSFGGSIMLSEHFRCVPEIIQFSNLLSYNGAIKPLRDASSVAVRPSTYAYRVNGKNPGNNTNEEEAQTIASLLVSATEQPEYAESTFGVISMLGAEQAALVDLLLQRHLAPAQYHRRRVQCGTAAQFQGDERHVVFLSMVYSPSEQGPLPLVPDPGERNKKRLNVAASRARDQLWVVHSVDPERDLKPGDLRRRLILHARDPKATMEQLEALERQTESDFEREVLRRLHALGYKVSSQWPVGPYRIDLVVSDGQNRLAVECDGDRAHPPEKLGEDMARQAILERLGWRFVRIRGSQFYRNPQASIDVVVARLDLLGISPARQDDTASIGKPGGDELRERVVRRAHELRRDWGSTAHVVQSAEPTRTPTKPQFGYDLRKTMQGNVDRSTAPDAPPRSSPVTTATEVRPPAPGTPASRPPRRQVLSPSDDGGLERTSPSNDDPASLLSAQGLEVIDKRSVGGALWVVGGSEIRPLLAKHEQNGRKFVFVEAGGRASGHRPAWYLR